MSLVTLQTIAIVAQGISAILILFITFNFNKGIKKIEKSRREDERKIAKHSRNKLRVEFIFKFEEHLQDIKKIKHDFELMYQNEVKGHMDFFVLKNFLDEMKQLKQRYELDENTILEVFNKCFEQKSWDEPTQDGEGTSTECESNNFFKTFNEAFSLIRQIKKDMLKLEVQTLINSTEILEPIKEIEQELGGSTAFDGHPILDITKNYLLLDSVSYKLEYVYNYLKRSIER
ncbi:hypothetical protein [Bacillus sp. J33]|uniref:hypothetical protein n=1 Tax=Bacillus sp. J33 TaxID=935836 RepID=UPI0004788578|nr:hypothetical protein [Bacillus sp. J33]